MFGVLLFLLCGLIGYGSEFSARFLFWACVSVVCVCGLLFCFGIGGVLVLLELILGSVVVIVVLLWLVILFLLAGVVVVSMWLVSELVLVAILRSFGGWFGV